MKKCIPIFVVLLLSAAVMVSSCKKEDANEVDPGPAIHLKEGAGYTSTNDTIESNMEIVVGVLGLNSPVSEQPLIRFKFSVISKNIQITFVDSTFSSNSFDWEAKLIPASSEGEVKLLFELWDRGGVRIEKSFDLIVNGIIPIDPGPGIYLKDEVGYTYMDGTIWVYDSIKVGVTGQKSIVSNQKLNRFRLSILSNNVATTITDTAFVADSFDWDTEITFAGAGEGRFLFELWDEGGMRNEKSFFLVVKDEGTAINKYVDVEFGSWNDATGSFFSSQEGVVYNISQTQSIPANQAKIDFLYFYGTTNKNTIASPDDADANSIEPLKLNIWTNRNQTRFNPIDLTVAQFNEIGENYRFPAFNYSTQATKMGNLKVNDIFMFKTEKGKFGLVMITQLSTPTRGDTAKATIIVQK